MGVTDPDAATAVFDFDGDVKLVDGDWEMILPGGVVGTTVVGDEGVKLGELDGELLIPTLVLVAVGGAGVLELKLVNEVEDIVGVTVGVVVLGNMTPDELSLSSTDTSIWSKVTSLDPLNRLSGMLKTVRTWVTVESSDNETSDVKGASKLSCNDGSWPSTKFTLGESETQSRQKTY